MRRRCYDKKRKDYKWYGAKGIIVCERWLTFKLFAADMAATWFYGATIERKDGAGNYEPANCSWKILAEQQRNRRHCLHTQKGPVIKRLLAEGRSQAAIGKELGMSQAQVSCWACGWYA